VTERRVRAVIVDDEPAARDVVRTMLAAHEGIEVVGEAGNGVSAVRVLRASRPDLLFLDVQMPDRDGFGVLEALGDEVPRALVFVTAHDEHAIRAFEVHALDYVLKPFGKPRFNAAVMRALDRLKGMDALRLRRTLESMAEDRRSAGGPPAEVALANQRIAVRLGQKVTLLDVASIDWVEADGDYARIHAGRASHLVSQRMHALERYLEPFRFIRVHRSLIVNRERVREMYREADGSGVLLLATGVRLRVARGRWDALEKALGIEQQR
jgi:two-component system, LytTR family, response regulator